MKKIMNIKELREYLVENSPYDYTTGTIYNFVSSGKLKAYRRGKPLLFEKKTVDKWINDKLK